MSGRGNNYLKIKNLFEVISEGTFAVYHFGCDCAVRTCFQSFARSLGVTAKRPNTFARSCLVNSLYASVNGIFLTEEGLFFIGQFFPFLLFTLSQIFLLVNNLSLIIIRLILPYFKAFFCYNCFMSRNQIYITKASGAKELFDSEKLENSLLNSGASPESAEHIVDHIAKELEDGMSSSMLYDQIG